MTSLKMPNPVLSTSLSTPNRSHNRLSFFLPFLTILLLPLIQQAGGWCLRTKFAGKISIQAMDFSSDNEFIVTGQSSGRVALWNADTLEILKIYTYAGRLWDVSMSKNKQFLAISGQTSTIDIIHPTTFLLIRQINTAQIKVYSVHIRSDSQAVLTCGDDKKLKIYNISTGLLINQTSVSNTPYSCRFTDNGFVTVSGLGFTESYNTGLTKVYGALRLTDVFYCMRAAPGSLYALAVSTTGLMLEAAITTPSNDQALTGASGFLYSCDYSSDSSNFAVAGTNSQVYLFNGTSRNNNLQAKLLTDSQSKAKSLKFSYDSSILLVGDENGTVHYFQRICNVCPVGTYALLNQCKYCSSVLPGCSICPNSTSCSSCMSGYFLNQTTLFCDSCADKIQGCANCNSSTNCTSCLPGYYKTGLICARCLTVQYGCVQCKAALQCEQCDNNHYLNGGICVRCSTIANCLYCNSSAYCINCLPGYYDNIGICMSCYHVLNPHCMQCQSSTNCTVCMDGYRLNLATYLCEKCSPQCLFCNSTNHCFECISQMFINSANTCQYCLQPCQTCTSSIYCLTCIQSYYLSAPGTCIQCQSPCLSCNSSTRCQSCYLGFYLDNSFTCQKCLNLYPNCRECKPSACYRCEIGFVISGGSCIACGGIITGCKVCEGSSICLECLTGYYGTGLTGASACKICQIGCVACVSSTNCSSCEAGFYLQGNSCVRCTNNCLSCKSSLATQCYSCVQKYYLSSTLIGSCLSCQVIPKCVTCHNNSYCLGCQIGYFLSSPTSCSVCIAPCVTCKNSATNCLTCDIGFSFYITGTGTGACQQCSYGCSECSTSPSVCLNCISGFYHNQVTSTCSQCYIVLPGCDVCSNQTSCAVCSSGYYPLLGSCQLCTSVIPKCLKCNVLATICSLCDYGFTLSTNNDSCVSCSNTLINCEQCKSSTVCQTCSSGFFEDSGICLSCLNGCLSCLNTTVCEVCFDSYILATNKSCILCQQAMPGCQTCQTLSQCKSCILGFYPSSATCISCQIPLQGCLTCLSSTYCTSCSIFYQLGPSNICTLCSIIYPFCQICSNSTIKCLQCENGFYLSSGDCVACATGVSQGCLKCLANDTCLECMTGYYLDTDWTCGVCNELFSDCIYCSATECFLCQSGFYLSAGNCVNCPGLGCQVCMDTNSSKCITCNPTHYLNPISECQLCTIPLNECLQCISSTTCIECSSGFFLNSSNKCQICGSKYLGCRKCTSMECFDCEANFFLNQLGVCQSCTAYVVGCAYCAAEGVCLSCQVGYYFVNQTCDHCSVIYGCSHCINDTICIKCQQSFFLDLTTSTCINCLQTIPHCYACTDNQTCISCQGHFQLVGMVCQQIKGEVVKKVANLQLKSYYINQTNIKHVLYALDFVFRVMEVDWIGEASLGLIGTDYVEIRLQLLQVYYGEGDTSIVFITNNPINDQLQNILKSMPLLKSQSANHRLLQSSSTASSIKIPYTLKLSLNEGTAQAIMPSLTQVGDLHLTYPLTQTQFYISFIRNIKYYHYLFGVVISVILLAGWSVRICCGAQLTTELNGSKLKLDRGTIVPRVFLIKCGALVLYPTYGEYISYCYGFMTPDLPWFNYYFGPFLGKQGQKVPGPFAIYYTNLSLGSTYFVATLTILLTWLSISAISYILTPTIASPNLANSRSNPTFFQKRHKIQRFKSFLYNYFIVGATMASCLCIQGVVLNGLQSFGAGKVSNTLLYIVGICIYVGIIGGILWDLVEILRQRKKAQAKIGSVKIYSTNNVQIHTQYKDPPTLSYSLHKVRILFLTSILSLSHIAPLYITSIAFCLQLICIVLEFKFFNQQKLHPKLHSLNQILMIIALFLIILVPDALIGIIFVSILVTGVIGVEVYIGWRELVEVDALSEEFRVTSHETIEKQIQIQKNILQDPYKKYREQNNQQKVTYCQSIKTKKFSKPTHHDSNFSVAQILKLSNPIEQKQQKSKTKSKQITLNHSIQTQQKWQHNNDQSFTLGKEPMDGGQLAGQRKDKSDKKRSGYEGARRKVRGGTTRLAGM